MKLVGSIQTGPANEPITLAEAQAHLIIDGQVDYVNSLIKAARMQVERYLNRSLILQTWKAYADQWCKELILPYGPVLAVTSLKYVGLDGTETTVSTSDYWVDVLFDRIVLGYDFVPPMLKEGRPSSVIVEYTAGYSSSETASVQQAAVPQDIKHAIKLIITDMHEHRGQYVVGNIVNKIPGYLSGLLHPYRLYNF